MAAYIQQGYAAKLIGLVVASGNELAEKVIRFQCCAALLNVIANTAYPESQKHAASTMIVKFKLKLVSY